MQNFALQPMEISKQYNSVPVKDNCVLFLLTPLFLGSGYPMVSFKFLACRPLLPGNKFWDKIDYNLAPVKDNCALFAPTSLIRSCWAICHGNGTDTSFHRTYF